MKLAIGILTAISSLPAFSSNVITKKPTMPSFYAINSDTTNPKIIKAGNAIVIANHTINFNLVLYKTALYTYCNKNGIFIDTKEIDHMYDSLNTDVMIQSIDTAKLNAFINKKVKSSSKKTKVLSKKKVSA